MALPGDVATCTVTFGPYTDATGAVTLAGATATLTPVDAATGKRINLAHVATGQVIVGDKLTVTIGDDGTATVGPLPHTDNPGLSTVGFAYRVEWNLPSSKPSPGSKTFALPAANGPTADFDKLVAAPAVPGVLVPFPEVGAAFVVHGSDANRPRPDVAVPVIWFGEVQPAAMTDADVYVATVVQS